ncbi:hypothetical protein CMT89_08525 [Elizabethkingia anophelis]|uniref:hypothetical protein n=1 Tax=Elizabethkingia anophelis TaxID=1117645 RepID=UPI000CE95D59|nr:hypothetical protein [Elizabethkingia anophelis]AVF48289.1 hypothetical protein AL491_09490 [Elizabethkingia anophelis]AVF52283.1 hypothetical protein AL492_11900 [Elizabethkingia anophelis]MBG0505922.1 hypothetical protein [Elizabethkingia anophelis]MDV3901235.1 hypothetical protein [Elizabethkingia anophelis]MDV4058387.1 hypothetical protein [Elizabethkingia anophelis]
MFNFYLSKIGYESASSLEIEDNFVLLNEIVVEEPKPEDTFLKNENIWNLITKEGILGDVVFSQFNDRQFASSVVPKLIESLKSIDEEFTTLDELDNSHYKIYNSFYGAKFDNPNKRHISDKGKYEQFKNENLWDLTSNTFWERRGQLFSKIVLCPTIENDLKTIGATYLNQIKNKLVELDNYVVKHWKKDSFNYTDANAKSSLNISPESKKTMEQEKYYNQRVFKLPDGRNECFELHIKTGNLRFHFFPEDCKIYVGYIGKHLDTDRFN